MTKKVVRSAAGKFLSEGGTAYKRYLAACIRQGFIDGMGGSVTVADAGKLAHLTYKGRGLKGDWIAVGDSIRHQVKRAS